jgi:UDP-N-acetylmuramyl tripeptide synthase
MSVDLPSRTRAAARVGGAIASVSRRLGRGSGSVIGGRAVLAIDPNALTRLAAGRRLAVVTGTNGKTTTTSLLRAALSTRGPVVTNVLGANLPSGLAAALAAAPPEAATAALEVDEAFLGKVIEATHADVAVLLNLSRDQLDRNNEVRGVAGRWRTIWPSAPQTHVVANADDPLVVWAALAASSLTWVGAGQPWTADAAACPRCGHWVRFDARDWACSACELRRPRLDLAIEDGTLVPPGGGRIPLCLSLPGRANRANAAMAAAAAQQFGVSLSEAVAAMAGTAEVAGRYRTIIVGENTRARLLLAKNPAGWLEVFDLLSPPPAPLVIAINARVADGKDPSWLWDVPFERLRGRVVVATGERSRDVAVRLHYARVEHRHEPDPVLAIASLASAGANRVDVVANYTAFQAISALAGHG